MTKHPCASQTCRLTDGLGSTTELLDGSGNVLVSYRYDAFGGIRSQSFAHANYWLFAGEQRDAETGYDYLRARYYDSGTGRFISVDPVTADRYVYAGANPVSRVDPLGLCWFWHDDPDWGMIPLDSNELGWGDECLDDFCIDAGRVCTPTLEDLIGVTILIYSIPWIGELVGNQIFGFSGKEHTLAAVLAVLRVHFPNALGESGDGRHGPGECWKYVSLQFGSECLERAMQVLFGTGLIVFGGGVIVTGCVAGLVLCPVAIVGGTAIMVGGGLVIITALMRWR